MFGSLQEAFSLLIRVPLVWTTGIIMGAAFGIDLVLEFSGETFFAGKVLLFGLLVLPFFVAGALGAMHRKDGSLAAFLEEGKKGYFRVLLPAIVLAFAAAVTLLLLAAPVALFTGESAGGAITSAVMGVVLSFAFFAYFYDAAAVTEELGIFASIQRSAALVFTDLWNVLLFYAANIAAFIGMGFAALFLLTALLYDKLAPIVESGETFAFDAVNATATQAEFAAILGPDGIWATALVYALFIAVFVPFALAFKAAFYARHIREAEEEKVVGEYDEKGRWYRY
ncbi:DUF7847 domain-containing protein [Methanofollis ethanolicus]|uniref:DUF7847 domain-containing protein n=1 Tax=Methanofollis ethanolicus TaxID=488124 RepID=UPI00083092E3|nr:hypothetical protein [Methanofollis ethanolicus]